MGLDLKVLVTNFRERDGEFLATASLRCDRDSRIFAQLARDSDPCIVQPIEDNLRVGHYEDDGIRFDQNDRHDNRLTFTTPLLLQGIQLPSDAVLWNVAIFKFLLALPPNSRIVLYWC